MDKTSKIALYAIGFVLLLMIVAEVTKPKALNWRDSYSASDKIPLGCYVLYNELKNHSNFEIESSESNLYEFIKTVDTTKNQTLFLVNNYIDLDDELSDKLLEFANMGNTVFISTRFLYSKLLDTFNLDFHSGYSKFFKEPTLQSFTNPRLKKSEQVFEDVIENSFFTSIDTTNALVLGTFEFADKELNNILENSANPKDITKGEFEINEKGDTIYYHQDDKRGYYFEKDDFDYSKNKINYIKMPVGKNDGAFLIHTNPFAFTNYHMLKGKANYAAGVLAYLPQQTIIWDNYYKSGRRVIGSPLRYILSNPSLKWAFYMVLFGLLMFVIFRGKRKQRVIPVIEPLKNATVDFTQTIGDLYYQNGDFSNIINKKIEFFLEFVRSHYYLDTNILNEQFQNKLAVKSANTKEDTKVLVDYLMFLKSKSTHTENELIELNKKLELFTKTNL
jgi:hypothetical protein